jgi:hypothetical protein
VVVDFFWNSLFLVILNEVKDLGPRLVRRDFLKSGTVNHGVFDAARFFASLRMRKKKAMTAVSLLSLNPYG